MIITSATPPPPENTYTLSGLSLMQVKLIQELLRHVSLVDAQALGIDLLKWIDEFSHQVGASSLIIFDNRPIRIAKRDV